METALINCMAALGEACSHASSLLFDIGAFSLAKEAKSCTQKECKWLLCKAVKEVPYLPVENSDFRGATRKMDALHCGNMDEDSNKRVKKKKTGETLDLNKTQRKKEFLKQIRLCGTRLVSLTLTEPYSESYVPFGSIKNVLCQICAAHHRLDLQLRSFLKNVMKLPYQCYHLSSFKA